MQITKVNIYDYNWYYDEEGFFSAREYDKGCYNIYISSENKHCFNYIGKVLYSLPKTTNIGISSKLMEFLLALP